METRLVHNQLVLFSPGIIITDKLKAANAINDSLTGLFDGDPALLPVPEDAPPEIPRIHLASKDGCYVLSIARSRIDFVFRVKQNGKKSPFPVPGLFEKFLTIFQYLTDIVHAAITRVANVAMWIVELGRTSGAEFLLSRYIRGESPVSRPHELELHYLTKESLAGFDVNKWLRIKSARKIDAPDQDRFVAFQVDINTLADLQYEITFESLQKFLEQSAQSMKISVEEHLSGGEK